VFFKGIGYSRICACAGLLFMWGHRKLSSSVCARSSLITGNNTRVVFIASQFNSLRSEEVSKIFWAFLSDNLSITTYWGNMTSRKEYYASRDASKVYQSVSILLFSSSPGSSSYMAREKWEDPGKSCSKLRCDWLIHLTLTCALRILLQ
jgi:hypothetical protein